MMLNINISFDMGLGKLTAHVQSPWTSILVSHVPWLAWVRDTPGEKFDHLHTLPCWMAYVFDSQ